MWFTLFQYLKKKYIKKKLNWFENSARAKVEFSLKVTTQFNLCLLLIDVKVRKESITQPEMRSSSCVSLPASLRVISQNVQIIF